MLNPHDIAAQWLETDAAFGVTEVPICRPRPVVAAAPARAAAVPAGGSARPMGAAVALWRGSTGASGASTGTCRHAI